MEVFLIPVAFDIDAMFFYKMIIRATDNGAVANPPINLS